eukprot:TRINITY_DN4818_c0_g1_i2.p1 TRINITY_DN4818_c0_g1~~TRINITY_DN4818_c0_g1_i2.p1  ORF type:complete len:392 (-),score=109.96 TRINITY_DN4818_c0_g1_i2:90-1265(-)
MKPEKRENRGVNTKRVRDDDGEEDITTIDTNNLNTPMTNTPPKRVKIRFKIGNENPNVTLVYDEPTQQSNTQNDNGIIENDEFEEVFNGPNHNNNNNTQRGGGLTTKEKLQKPKAKPIEKKKAKGKAKIEEDGSDDFDEEDQLDYNSDLDIMDENEWDNNDDGSDGEPSDDIIDQDDLDLDDDEANLTPTSNTSSSTLNANKKLTSRQLAMQNGGSEELFSLPLGFQKKVVNISAEVASRKRAENAAKRKHQAQIDRDEQKDMIIAQLLNRSTKKKEDEREIRVLPVRYKSVPDSLRYVSNANGNTLSIPTPVLSMTMALLTQHSTTPTTPATTTTTSSTTPTATPTPQTVYPPSRKCQFCSNSRKYSSKTGISVCSLECFKKIPQKEIAA